MGMDMNRDEIGRLIDNYSSKVYNLAYRVTGSKQDAEDVVQETFMQVYESIDKFRGDSAIYTWIYKIALNNSLKIKKRLDKAYVDSLEEKIEIFKDDIPGKVQEWYTDPEKSALINELLSEIRNGCLHLLSFRLPENQRIVYIMRNVLGFSYDEISEVLGISNNVVKARLNRARKNLNEYFSNRCQWLTKDNTCTCHSRIGIALALDPEILKRVEAQAVEVGIVNKSETDMVYAKNIDELYEKFPMIKYKVESLKQTLSKNM